MFNIKGYLQGALLNVVKDALIKKVANEEERDSLIANVVSKSTKAVDDKFKISKSKFGQNLSEKGFTKDKVDGIASTVADVAIGLASNYLISKLNNMDLDKILLSKQRENKADNEPKGGSKDGK